MILISTKAAPSPHHPHAIDARNAVAYAGQNLDTELPYIPRYR